MTKLRLLAPGEALNVGHHSMLALCLFTNQPLVQIEFFEVLEGNRGLQERGLFLAESAWRTSKVFAQGRFQPCQPHCLALQMRRFKFFFFLHFSRFQKKSGIRPPVRR